MTQKSTSLAISLWLLLAPGAPVLADEGATTSSASSSSASSPHSEPAFVTPSRLAPLPGNDTTKEFQILPGAKPIFEKRLAELLEQINTAESKGWITSDEASGFKRQHSDVATQAASIHDPLDADRKTVDEVDSKITVLNAALYAASNKKQPSTESTPETEKIQQKP